MSESDVVATLKKSVERGLSYLEVVGDSPNPKIGIWTSREVLCHLIYWHRATAEGMESVSSGGSPLTIYASTDEMNARAVGRVAGVNMKSLMTEARELQVRLLNAYKALVDPSAIVMVRQDIGNQSGKDRMQMIARHWDTHINELENTTHIPSPPTSEVSSGKLYDTSPPN